jgi:hypothetical protein
MTTAKARNGKLTVPCEDTLSAELLQCLQPLSSQAIVCRKLLYTMVPGRMDQYRVQGAVDDNIITVRAGVVNQSAAPAPDNAGGMDFLEDMYDERKRDRKNAKHQKYNGPGGRATGAVAPGGDVVLSFNEVFQEMECLINGADQGAEYLALLQIQDHDNTSGEESVEEEQENQNDDAGVGCANPAADGDKEEVTDFEKLLSENGLYDQKLSGKHYFLSFVADKKEAGAIHLLGQDLKATCKVHSTSRFPCKCHVSVKDGEFHNVLVELVRWLGKGNVTTLKQHDDAAYNLKKDKFGMKPRRRNIQ